MAFLETSMFHGAESPGFSNRDEKLMVTWAKTLGKKAGARSDLVLSWLQTLRPRAWVTVFQHYNNTVVSGDWGGTNFCLIQASVSIQGDLLWKPDAGGDICSEDIKELSWVGAAWGESRSYKCRMGSWRSGQAGRPSRQQGCGESGTAGSTWNRERWQRADRTLSTQIRLWSGQTPLRLNADFRIPTSQVL